MKLLMHTCCAPCSVYCIDALREEGIEPVSYWFNPNIHPYQEYKTRKETLIKYSQIAGFELIINDNYGLDEFCKNVSDDIKNRCTKYCYLVRLEQTVKYAKENNFDAFTTTLLVSPYQKHEEIIKICKMLSEKYDIEFLYRDFRIGFKRGQAKAREIGLYMQKYCGCIFSEEDRYLGDVQDYDFSKIDFLPTENLIKIKKVKDNKENYLSLLLEADPSEKLVSEYLKNGDLFVLTNKEETICVAVVIKIDDDTVELKNIATKELYRNKGYGKKMLKYLEDNYKTRFKKMIVGTSENNIPFYVKLGFDKYEKTIKNFFIDNYDEEIYDGDLKCIDMFYYSKLLNN